MYLACLSNVFRYQFRKYHDETKNAPKAAYTTAASVANNCELPLSVISSAAPDPPLEPPLLFVLFLRSSKSQRRYSRAACALTGFAAGCAEPPS